MGSKEEDVPKEPVEKTVFVEDMNESELATAVSIPEEKQCSYWSYIQMGNYLILVV